MKMVDSFRLYGGTFSKAVFSARYGKYKIIINSRDDQNRADDLIKRNFGAHRPHQI